MLDSGTTTEHTCLKDSICLVGPNNVKNGLALERDVTREI